MESHLSISEHSERDASDPRANKDTINVLGIDYPGEYAPNLINAL